MATKNNFTLNQNYELTGHEVTILAVDFINTMAAEITHQHASAAATAGLNLSMEAIQNQGVNILGKGALGNSNTEQTYMVRADALDTISSTTTLAAIQAAIIVADAYDPDIVTADISGATANDEDMSDTAV